MSEQLVVEVWGKPAGFILKEGNSFRFHALGRAFSELDGTEFTTLGHARLAAARLQPPKPDFTPATDAPATGTAATDTAATAGSART